MDFPDNSFDVLCASYVIRYSYDFKKCASEMIRVVKPGGVIALSYAANESTAEVYPTQFKNLSYLLAQFDPYVEKVYWQMDEDDRDESELPRKSCMTVFKVQK